MKPETQDLAAWSSSVTWEHRVEAVLASLQVSPDFIASRALPLCQEAETLVVAECGPDGREHLLVPAAADAWRAMRAAARADGLEIRVPDWNSMKGM